MLPILAIPVLHSSGAWIVTTAASGYLAGTLSGTWASAFILGNASLLCSLGLVLAAGWIGATASLSSMAASTAALTGSGLRREIREQDDASKLELLQRAAKGKTNWQISVNKHNVSINDDVFPLSRTKFAVNEDKNVSFVILNKFGRIVRRFRVDPKAI